MINSESHFYLYAKNHYKTTDVIEDLKIIQGNWCGIEPQYIGVDDIMHHLLVMIYPEIVRYHEHPHKFIDFINSIMPNNTWKVGYVHNTVSCCRDKRDELPPYEFERAVIHKCLSILRWTELSNITGELAEPNYTILPSSKEPNNANS